MNCCQCQGIEEFFSRQFVNKELTRYRARGADKTTHLLTEAIKSEGVAGLTLLDIGGGVGAVQHALIEAGLQRATSVDASSAYLNAAQEEARRRGIADRISYQHGNFADLAADISPAEIVTLDRVICCYPDMEKLVSLSAARAGKMYGVVYPRDTWWVKIGLALGNLYFRLRRNPFRTYSHATRSVEAIIGRNGLKRHYYRKTFAWQVAVYTR
jgi:ubiquinone/menaquinone biosynthesis C-methylase UbiE